MAVSGKKEVWQLEVKWGSPDTLYGKMGKRIVDLILSTIAIIVLLPFCLIISAIIKFDSSGPAFFTQERVGKDGVIFNIYKFRSMYIDTPSQFFTPSASSDPRITRVGRFIRKYSLDEIPQLINVLKGDMSLVGPRPEMVFIASQYTAQERLRLSVLPGITGLWQLSSARKEPIHYNLQYDFYYINNKSFLLDLSIMFKTIFVLGGKNTF